MSDKALLVLDMVNEYIFGDKPLLPVSERPKVIARIKKIIGRARNQGISVIYVSTAFRRSDPILSVIGYRQQAMAGSTGAQIIPDLNPHHDDYSLRKHGYDGFWGTRLERLLRKLKTKTVYLTGCQTDCCVRETGVTAAHLGYDVVVIEDCCSTSREFGQQAAIRFMKTCVGKIVQSRDLSW